MSGFDLGSYDFDDPMPAAPSKPVDTSGKPAPTEAFLITSEGHRMQAEITFDGIDPVDGKRRYALIAESDWLSLHPVRCEIDQHPPDVSIMFKMPGDYDPEHLRQMADILREVTWIIGGQPPVYAQPILRSEEKKS